ncbi:IS66 family transposase [Serratia inhibens]|uniref:IS66 family transposase n=1 Tax=Serratia inhibens TaxID=2338073 RepID=UPI003C7D6589
MELNCRAKYWEAQHARVKAQLEEAKQEILLRDAKIKDLQNRVFGKRSEKAPAAKSEKDDSTRAPCKRNRGQQPNSCGHGRTQRPDLPVVHDEIDLSEDDKSCPQCGLPHLRNRALDEHSDVIEVAVSAHIRRYTRPAYTRNPGCTCEKSRAVVTASPPPRLIARSPYGVGFWVEVILGKFRYAQPTHRYLQDLQDQGLVISPGTVAGGLQALAPLFEPILEAWYCRQMSEKLFHNDETRWEVFVPIEGKVGTRWYLWVTRSPSVVFYCIDPSRSAAVPGAHFAGLHSGRVIIVCDRYSAYKKLARLAANIVLAFCWAHVRRDYLDAGRGFAELEGWALQWKERIGALYHLNGLRLEHWDPERPLAEQSAAFKQHHEALKQALQLMHDEASRVVALGTAGRQSGDPADRQGQQSAPGTELSKSAQTKRKQVLQSLLEHWSGLTVFVEHPEVPMDNNAAERSIRHPVTGRKNYYGSGSIWSAELAATLFSILQTLALWGINPRHWLTLYLQACAENGGQAPRSIEPFLPWSMDETRRAELIRPYPSHAPPASSREPAPVHDRS